MKKRGRSLLTTIFRLSAMLLMFSVFAMPSLAQKGKESQLRTVRGAVVDKDENPVRGGAIVYLKNLKSQVVKTYIAEDNGEYRFSGLDPNVDYELHAEHQELASPKRTISSYDTKKEIVIHLKLTRKRE